jgi:hypothetical protein
VGLYSSLEKKLAPFFGVKESVEMLDLGKWNQAKWNKEKIIPRQQHL